MIEFDPVREAGLTDCRDQVRSFRNWFAFFVAILTPIFAVAGAVIRVYAEDWFEVFLMLAGFVEAPFLLLVAYLTFAINQRIPAKARRIVKARRNKGIQQEQLTDPIWHLKSEREFEVAGFVDVSRDRSIGSDVAQIKLFEKTERRDGSEHVRKHYAVRRNDVTLAIATVLGVSADAIWQFRSFEKLEDGKNEIDLQQAISASKIDGLLSESRNKTVEVVCIGIQSKHEPAGKTRRKSLSAQRAFQILKQMRRPEYVWFDYPYIQFVGVDLGSANSEKAFNSHAERRQRAAIIVILSRTLSIEEKLPFRQAIAEIVAASEFNGSNLSEFEFSENPERGLLSESLPQHVPTFAEEEQKNE